jgi:hypothetical protein
MGGSFNFDEGGKVVSLPIKINMLLLPDLNQLQYQLIKFVYRGVVNPMTISFAGIADSDVSASATGLSLKWVVEDTI